MKKPIVWVAVALAVLVLLAVGGRLYSTTYMARRAVSAEPLGSATPASASLPFVRVSVASGDRTLIGWFSYFRHCQWHIFGSYDARIRKRLRRMLLKRHRHNPRRLSRTRRWPNAFFTEHGLYSLSEAHTRFVQSQTGNY